MRNVPFAVPVVSAVVSSEAATQYAVSIVRWAAAPDGGAPSAPPDTRIVDPSIEAPPADTRANVVSVACPNSIVTSWSDESMTYAPVPKLPASPAAAGSPVTFVITPEAGVPRAGATNVLLLSVCALVLKVNSSSTSAKSGIVSVTPPTVCEAIVTVSSWPFVISKGDAAEGARDVAEATPSVGVVNAGDVPNTNNPLPVSFEITPASCAEVVAANCESGSVVKASPLPPPFGRTSAPRENKPTTRSNATVA